MNFFKRLIYIIFVLLPLFARAGEPFDNCPTEAFLIQTPSNSPITYGVDLSTGSYNILSPNMGTTKVNGVGFSYHDNYMYGWDYAANSLGQFGSDFQSNSLTITGNIPGNFYVGDVSVIENAWYGYRPNQGLYKIDLTNPSGTLSLVRVATSSAMGNPPLTDFAFHPEDGLIYAVDNNGFLLTIDPGDGSTTVIKQVLDESVEGFNFTFGAQYFDVTKNLYISNNGNGYVYKINLNQVDPIAVFFAYGPSSSSNDGARCALAPVLPNDSVDFGDAPDSYGTSFENGGARHQVSGVYLGLKVDAESNSYTYPMSDDQSDGADDDDGVLFVTNFETTQQAVINVTASDNGAYLNAWIDWDADGSFDNDEIIADGVLLNAGVNTLIVNVPVWASIGETWSRFRVSSFQSVGPTGGVSDGEVEDYALNIIETGVSTYYYPSQNSFTTFAYEDLFPEQGDFDMNDVVMQVRITEFVKDQQVIRLKIEGKLVALGASYNNGFAIHLPNIQAASIKGNSIAYRLNGENVEKAVLDSTSEAVLMIEDGLWDIASPGEAGCYYFRTELNCETSNLPEWEITVPFSSPVSTNTMPAKPYDPFIFAKPGTYHGDLVASVVGGQPGRAFEVHLKNYAPTSAFDLNLLSIADDDSDINLVHYFLNTSGLPWAIEVPISWKHPYEKVSILEAYPQFYDFAGDETGATNPEWYLLENANPSKIFQY